MTSHGQKDGEGWSVRDDMGLENFRPVLTPSLQTSNIIWTQRTMNSNMVMMDLQMWITKNANN
jgi:hypothetical protein